TLVVVEPLPRRGCFQDVPPPISRQREVVSDDLVVREVTERFANRGRLEVGERAGRGCRHSIMGMSLRTLPFVNLSCPASLRRSGFRRRALTYRIEIEILPFGAERRRLTPAFTQLGPLLMPRSFHRSTCRSPRRARGGFARGPNASLLPLHLPTTALATALEMIVPFLRVGHPQRRLRLLRARVVRRDDNERHPLPGPVLLVQPQSFDQGFTARLVCVEDEIGELLEDHR